MMDRDDRSLSWNVFHQIVPRSVACVVLCRLEKFFPLPSCNLGSRVLEQTRDNKLIKCKLPGDHDIMTSGPVTSVPEGPGAVMSDVLT